MALRVVNISITYVRNALAAAYSDIGSLCLYVNINKWSKKKPVRGAWPESGDGKYGFDLLNNWAYNKPRGTANNEPFRLGDFRGYEHNLTLAFPSIQSRESENEITDLDPTGSSIQNYWTVRFYKTASEVIVLPADLGMSSYYFGMKVTVSGITWYKTLGTIASVGYEPGMSFALSAELTDPSGPVYAGLPFGVGVCSWQLFVCSTIASVWTMVAPSNVVNFPTGTDGVNVWASAGSFTISEWITGSNADMSFSGSGGAYQASIIYATKITNPEFALVSNPGWVTVGIYSGGTIISNNTLWASGMEARLTASVNYGAARTGDVVFSSNGKTFTIALFQAAGVASYAVLVEPAVGETWTMIDPSGSIFEGSDQLNFIFTPTDFVPFATLMDVVITRVGVVKYSGTCYAREGYVTNETVTINEAPVSGTYEVQVSVH